MQVCPHCGGQDLYGSEVKSEGYAIALLPDIGGMFASPKFLACVCSTCGYYRLFLPPEYLGELAQKWQKIS